MNQGKIILLNGVSSSGKSSLAIELQRRLDEAFLHLQLDAFIQMLPRLDDGDLFMRMVSGMNRCIAAMSDEGINLIVDHVVIEKEWMDQLLELLGGRHVLFVGLHCSLDELERRERTRDQRRQGFARAQVPKIHTGKIYDVEVDTGTTSVDECAARVVECYRAMQPTAFDRMRAEVESNAVGGCM